jgi:outer membrane protein assembly factor BamB
MQRLTAIIAVVATRLTTICCSALALIAASVLAEAAQSTPPSRRRVKQTYAADDRTPLALFPLRTLWTLGLNNSLTAPPAFDATRGFFPLEGDQLAAYNLATGARLWIASIRTNTEPAAGDDRVFVVGAGVLTALRATDGSSAWELPFTEALSVPPVVDNGWLITVTMAGDVLAFRAADGALIWRRNIGASAHARPAMSGDRVYVPTSDSRVVTLRVDTGAPTWERRLGGAANDIFASEGRLFLGSQDKYMYCLNAEDGNVEWRWQTGAAVIGLPVADDRSVFFVSLDNVLRGLKRSSGVQRWKSALPLRPTAGPIRAGDALVVAGPAPTLKAYNAQDGKAAGEFAMAGELAAPPHLFTLAQGSFPIVIAITRDIIKGAIVVALTRSVDPPVVPFLPLPNVIPMNPQGSTATPSGGPPMSSPANPERGPLVIPPTPR